MMPPPEMRSPAPALTSEWDRAEGALNKRSSTINAPTPEVDFATQFVARRYRLAVPIAPMVCNLASLGRACA